MVAQAAGIAVMRAGKVVETEPAENVLKNPRTEYARELLAAVPEMGSPRV